MRISLQFLLPLVFAAVACSEATNSTGMISKRIGEVARQAEAREVDLGTLTSFGWDRLYVFREGATRDEMCGFMGANRNACGRVIRVDRTPDGHVGMVFDLRGQVTHFEFHALENGRFDVAFGDNGIPRSETVFRIRRSTGTGDLRLEAK